MRLAGIAGATALALVLAAPAYAQTEDLTEPDEDAQTVGEITGDVATDAAEAEGETADTDSPEADATEGEETDAEGREADAAASDAEDIEEADLDTGATGLQGTGEASEATDGDAQVGGTPIDEAIEEADGATTAATDPAGQGAAQEQAFGEGVAPPDPMSRSMMLDLDAFAGAIFERGYRQGYAEGMADAREMLAREIDAMRRQAQTRQQQQQQPRRDRRGSVIVLPPGISPEQFIERLQRGN